jgi:polar amino acid transport system substrate-binding protein
MAEAYERLGKTMEVQYFPTERAIVTANDGIVDGELGRVKNLGRHYSNLRRIPVTLATIDIVAFSKDATIPMSGWDSLRPYIVGYVRGVQVIEQNIAQGTQLQAVTTLKQAFKLLNVGRVDIALDARYAGLKTIKDLGLTGITTLEPPLVQIKLFHYLHIKHQDLLEPLTAILQQMEKEGSIQRIQQQVKRTVSASPK